MNTAVTALNDDITENDFFLFTASKAWYTHFEKAKKQSTV